MIEEVDRTRVVKLLGMLTSDFDGERANAASFLTKIAARYKMTIPQLCGASVAEAASRPTRRSFDCTLLDALREARSYPSLSPWERNFASDVSTRYVADDSLSDKQRVIVDRILIKVNRSGSFYDDII